MKRQGLDFGDLVFMVLVGIPFGLVILLIVLIAEKST